MECLAGTFLMHGNVEAYGILVAMWCWCWRGSCMPWSDCEETPHVQGQRGSPSKMVGGVKLHFESKPIPARNARRAKTKPCLHQDPETPQRLSQTFVFESPVEAWVISGLPQGQGLWVQLPGPHSLWHKPFWEESTINPTTEPPSRWPTSLRTIIPKKFLDC